MFNHQLIDHQNDSIIQILVMLANYFKFSNKHHKLQNSQALNPRKKIVKPVVLMKVYVEK